MSGICGYLPSETLSDWCAEVNFASAPIGIAITMAAILVLNRLRQQDEPQTAVRPLQDRVVVPDENDERLLRGATNLAAFLRDSFTNPDSKGIMAKSFIKNPQDLLQDEPQELWAFLIRTLCSTGIAEQLDTAERSSQEVVIDFWELSELVCSGPESIRFALKALGKPGKEAVVQRFLNEVAGLIRFLEDFNGEDFNTVAGRVFGRDLVQDLRKILLRLAPVVAQKEGAAARVVEPLGE